MNGSDTITLSVGQITAVDAINRWLKNPNAAQAFVLAGYAGTGKTTVMRWIVEASDVAVHCCAPTGKAASVLASKLPRGTNVSTIHSLLYTPQIVTEATLTHALNNLEELKALGLPLEAAERRAVKVQEILEKGGCEFSDRDRADFEELPLVIVDEASMVSEKMEADLRRSSGRILFVGDSGQLPPVEGRDFFERNKPDAVLDEIHRQSADSVILRAATCIRKGERFDGWNDTDCQLVKGASLETLAGADQILTGMNVTRRRLNQDLRRHAGHGLDGAIYPELGEPIMCLKNVHGRGLINGVGGVVSKAADVDSFGDVRIGLSYEGQILRDLPIDPFAFDQYADPTMTRRDRPPTGDPQFDFGYAITVHKAQGSEWPHVVIWDDKMRRHDVEARRRWTYTAITRASERVTWVNGGRK